MLHGSLRYWDMPGWHGDRSYSPSIAAVLQSAYSYLLKDEMTASKLRAHATVHPYRDERMCERQRLRVYYVLGLGYAADGKYPLAMFCLDEALERIAVLGPPADEIEIYTHKAGINRAAFEFSEGIDDYRIALSILREASQAASSRDLPQELRLLGQMAGLEFFLARFPEAQEHLDEGFALAAGADADLLSVGALHASQAHLDQLTGRYDTAIGYAEWAAQAYQQAGHTVSAGRLRCLCAEILTRQVERLQTGDERSRLIARAARAVADAQHFAVSGSDEIGQGLISLIDTRLSRLSSLDDDRIARIERVGALARKWDDTPLLVQTFTALGDELVANGQVDSGKHRYRDAIALMDGGEASALALWPKRALLRHSENEG